MGYRFRLYRKDLPGKPDIVLPKFKIVILVHGCFWHRHKGCKRCTTPSTNKEYWLPKLQRNINKDLENRRQLRKLGWKPVIVWECEIKNTDKLTKKLKVSLQ
jgi:DNA mismatch endonuclease (patch repair protein)